MKREEKGTFTLGVVFIIILAVSSWMGTAYAQDKYPKRAIDIIISVPPGAGVDLTARVISSFFNKKWRVPVNAINKPGGNSIPAILDVYSASPDGHTLLCDSFSTSAGMSLLRNLPFKIMDRTFFGRVAATPLLLMVPATSPYKTIDDVAQAALKDPGSFTWTSLGGTMPPDYIIRQFFKVKGIDVRLTKPVIAKGGSEATVLTAGGHVKLGAGTTTGILQAYRNGTVRPLGISGKGRNPDYPEIPTFEELGYPQIGFLQWYGISGPAKVPIHIVEAWEKGFQEMVKDPEVVKKSNNIGAIPYYVSAAETREIVLKQIDEMQELLK